MKRVRSMIASAWQMRKDEPAWQVLFDAFCSDEVQPATPPKKSSKKPKPNSPKPGGEDDGLATPPRPDDPNKAKGLKRADGAKPVPLTVRENPPSPNMAFPGAKRLRTMEPEVPDLEENFHNIMQKPPPQDRQDPSAVNVEDVDEDMLAEDTSKLRKRKHHERACKSRKKSAAELRAKKLDMVLGAAGINYQTFLSFHRKAAYLKKAATCQSGGWWKDFKAAMVSKKIPECNTCYAMMKAKGVTCESIEQAMNDDSFEFSPTVQKEAEQEKQGKEKEDEGDDQDADDELPKILKYLDTLKPTIEVIDSPAPGPPILYRCTICVNKNNPKGKVNKLSRINYKQVRYLMNQHLTSPYHRGKMQEMEEQGCANTTEHEVRKCDGFIIDLKGYPEDPPSSLHNYAAEIRLWTNYTSMTNLPLRVDVQAGEKENHNEYCVDLATDSLKIRSRGCQKNYVPTDVTIPCCHECWSVTGPKRLQKTVVRFCTKFYAAQLLQKRLFFPENQLKEWLDDLRTSTYGINNAITWQGIQNLSNRELQTWVRKSWTSINITAMSPAVEAFISSVVAPCLQVHVGSIKSNLVALSSQFLDALCSNQQSEPRQNSGFMDLGWFGMTFRFYRL